ncbi:MAG: dockerin type I repeat-containing protein, partial [Clostridia bacterium]|nr:dockerin type I repeat-containing protein [Clostridia bacterium]
DGKIDSVDYLLIKRSAFGTYTLTEAMTLAGDINSDNLINSVDYLLVKRACFGTYKI